MEASFTWKDIRGHEGPLGRLAPFPGAERAVLRAFKKAGRDMIRAMKTASQRSIRFRKRIRIRRILDGLRVKIAPANTLQDLEWRMDVSGAPIPLVEYPHRQTARGVSVAVNQGRRKLVKSAFEATMKSGHVGVFLRRGKGRLPIDELFSSRLSDVMQDSEAIPAVTAAGFKAFNATWDRVFPLELDKL
jgi:hypothetical protein